MRFVKIGANDGLTDRHLSDYRNLENSGKLVEPVPFLFNLLKHNIDNPSFQFLNAAVSDFLGDADFYFLDLQKFRQGRPHWLLEIGSFRLDHITKHFSDNEWQIFGHYLKKIKIKVITLDHLLAEFDHLDVLFIDAEGSDFKILNHFSFRIKPRKIIFERKHMTDEEKTHVFNVLNQNYNLVNQGQDVVATIK